MSPDRIPKKGRTWRLLGLGVLPLLLAIPFAPSIPLWWFTWREPTYRIPLESALPLKIREDPFGSGAFGARRSGGRFHRGVDVVAPLGTPVYAAKSGVVALGKVKSGLGRYLEVRHPDGWITRYGHLKTIVVSDRQRVRRGQVLGTVGKSGNAQRRLIESHLHFEVWSPEGAPVDPLNVLETADGV